LVRIIRRISGSVVTWRRAQMVLLSAQGMDVPAIAKVAFTSEDRVREVIRNFNADGFGSLYPKYKGGRQPKFTRPGTRPDRGAASRPFTNEFTFRRCPRCEERNLVRDGDFTCAICDAVLPASWNFADDMREGYTLAASAARASGLGAA